MVERGTVVGINGGDVDVMFKRTSACGKCCACGMMVGSDEMTIPLKNTIGATMGDKVIVEFSGKKSLKSSVIVYVFPLVFFVVGILLGYSFGNVVFHGSVHRLAVSDGIPAYAHQTEAVF